MPHPLYMRRIVGGDAVNNSTSFIFPSSPYCLYSMRKYSGYSGYCMKVRRDSDNATLDIGFDNGDIDLMSLSSFVGAGSGFVEKWYDQSGFNFHIEQPNSIYQPMIVNSGSIILGDNGLPTVDFLPAGDGVHLLFPTGLLYNATEVSLFAVWDITTSSNDGVFGPSIVNSQGLEILSVDIISRPSFLRINGTVRNDNAGAGYQMWDSNATSLTTFIGNNASISVRKNGGAVSLTDSSAMPALSFNGQYALGLYVNVGNSMNGNVQEFALFLSDQTSNITTIETMMNNHYTIF